MKWFFARIDTHVVVVSVLISGLILLSGGIVMLTLSGQNHTPQLQERGPIWIGLACLFLVGQGMIWTRNTGYRRPPRWDAILVNEIIVLSFCGLGCLLIPR